MFHKLNCVSPVNLYKFLVLKLYGFTLYSLLLLLLKWNDTHFMIIIVILHMLWWSLQLLYSSASLSLLCFQMIHIKYKPKVDPAYSVL
jgi:hypothetical protein